MRSLSSFVCGMAFLAVVGCGGGVKEETVEVKASPLVPIQNTLERYAKGQPVMSEVTSFPYLVNEMKKIDAAKGEILEKGLAYIEKNPSDAKAKSIELMKKLGLDESKDGSTESKDAKEAKGSK